MKTNSIAWCIMVLICGLTSARAQDKAAVFGKVNDSELAMKVYGLDTTAVAVILSDVGYSHFIFGSGAKLVFERHTRIKILKKSGYDWANVAVPVYRKGSDRERVSGVKGFTYNLLDGKVVKDKLEQKSVFEEQRSEHNFATVFIMPNVKEGSVIEYSYTVTSDFIYNLRDWEFQTTIPVVWSEYRAQIPQYFDYKFLQHGYHSLHKPLNSAGDKKAGDNGIYTWVMKDVPALREERYITTLSDYQSKLEFELQRLHIPGESSKTMTGTWPEVTSKLLKHDNFGVQLNRKGYFKNETAAIAAQHSQPEQQMEAIYDLVKKTMRWDGKYGVITTGPLRKAFENKKGSAADINLMLTAMLQDAGLEASPVLVSTRGHGKIFKDTPLINKFNFVVAHVTIGKQEYLLDATDPLLPLGTLSVQCLNGEGRLIKENQERWVALKPAAPYTRFYNIDLTVSDKGEIKGKGSESYGGYSALNLRQTILEEGEQKYAEKQNKEVGDMKRSNLKIKKLDTLKEALMVDFDLFAKGSEQANQLLYLSPMLGYGLTENPFKLSERYYPVDFAAPIDETFMCSYTLPAGYVVDDMPGATNIALPNNGGRFVYMIEQEGNILRVISKFSISQTVFQPQEYGALRELYTRVAAKHAEQIVLKKSSM